LAARLPGRSGLALRDLSVDWRERVQTPRARAQLAVATVLLFVGFLLARRGTLPSRGLTVVGVLALAALAVWARLRESELWRDPSRSIARLAGRVDAALAGRAVRALALVQDDAPPGTSAELAELHVARALGALPRDRILDRADRIAGRYATATAILAASAVVLAATRGFSICEGADVLFAATREAPVPMVWLRDVEVEVRPPEYLHEHERELDPSDGLALPRGTLLTFIGREVHPGRRLLLTDGKNDVPFVDDGAGHMVARWPLGESVTLRVVARFGQVDIREPSAVVVASIPDELPTVTLDGAPRVIRLSEVGTNATIPIVYSAMDDHGLREVQLVLRSAGKEDRRILARLDGETDENRGGYTLHGGDPFIKKAHAPVEIRVEAKDNDAVTGPKWGVSAAITVIPPEAGEPEALRLDALHKLRDTFVDSLATRIDRVFPVTIAGRAPLVVADEDSVASDERTLDVTARGSYAGVGLSQRLVALLRGHMRRVKEALTVEKRSPGSASHARLVEATERLVLVTDGVMRGRAQRDARSVARGLADVADDLVLAASELQRTQERERGETHADGSVIVLSGGARSLHRLGSLGRDRGEIVDMDLLRVARARDEDDPVHAEIAASDLAARLKDPDPSFSSQGTSGGRAGGESGGGQGTAGDASPSEEAEQAFEETAKDLSKLSSDHAEELGKVEQALNDTSARDDSPGASEENKSHARAIREATHGLPSIGAGSDSWTTKGAAARDHAEAMARALEDGNATDAVSSGRSALDALDEAKQVAQAERRLGAFSLADEDVDRTGADERLAKARQKLAPEVKWAEQKLAALQKSATQKNMWDLSSHGEEEQRLADRAGSLHDQGEGKGALPESALEALHQAERAADQAAQALKHGDAHEGLAQQREAQRSLEMAERALGGDGEDEGGGGGLGEKPDLEHTDIPSVDAHKGPEEFRRRVMAGLGQAASGRQKDAIRRYAEGLLR
jgi:hypothetical protein